jgi:hypothetical protein
MGRHLLSQTRSKVDSSGYPQFKVVIVTRQRRSGGPFPRLNQPGTCQDAPSYGFRPGGISARAAVNQNRRDITNVRSGRETIGDEFTFVPSAKERQHMTPYLQTDFAGHRTNG